MQGDEIGADEEDSDLLGPIQQFDVRVAMTKLIEESGGGSEFDCHQRAHDIGREGYRTLQEEAFRACDASCHSGCYHGAMEEFLREEGTAGLAEKIGPLCDTFRTSFGRFECLHGVGHGVTAYRNFDLPAALGDCDKLSDVFAQTSCYGGVFMENIITGQGVGSGAGFHATEWLSKTDPHFPCNGIDQDRDVQYHCYQMQTSWMLTIYDYDFDRVVQECLNAPEAMIPVCFKSYGRDAAGHTLRDPKRIAALCDKVVKPEEYYEQCVVGAVNVIIDFWGPGLRGQASALCRILPEEGKRVCYTTLAGRIVRLFETADEMEIVCGTFEKAYRYLCE